MSDFRDDGPKTTEEADDYFDPPHLADRPLSEARRVIGEATTEELCAAIAALDRDDSSRLALVSTGAAALARAALALIIEGRESGAFEFAAEKAWGRMKDRRILLALAGLAGPESGGET